jgi:hypothetical protein
MTTPGAHGTSVPVAATTGERKPGAGRISRHGRCPAADAPRTRVPRDAPPSAAAHPLISAPAITAARRARGNATHAAPAAGGYGAARGMSSAPVPGLTPATRGGRSSRMTRGLSPVPALCRPTRPEPSSGPARPGRARLVTIQARRVTAYFRGRTRSDTRSRWTRNRPAVAGGVPACRMTRKRTPLVPCLAWPGRVPVRLRARLRGTGDPAEARAGAGDGRRSRL